MEKKPFKAGKKKKKAKSVRCLGHAASANKDVMCVCVCVRVTDGGNELLKWDRKWMIVCAWERERGKEQVRERQRWTEIGMPCSQCPYLLLPTPTAAEPRLIDSALRCCLICSVLTAGFHSIWLLQHSASSPFHQASLFRADAVVVFFVCMHFTAPEDQEIQKFTLIFPAKVWAWEWMVCLWSLSIRHVKTCQAYSHLDSVLLADDSRAVYPRSAAQHAPPAGGVGVRRPGLPGSGDLRLEEEMPVLLHPPPPRHHDSEPGSYNLDPQSHELHSGKKVVC